MIGTNRFQEDLLPPQNGEADGDKTTARPAIVPISAGDLIERNPTMRRVVVDCLARLGETINIIASSKAGKSWLVYLLVLCIATGRKWLGMFQCTQGRVLLIDNELHPETLSHRLTAVAEALGIGDEWRGMVDVITLRGRLVDLYGLQKTIEGIAADTYLCVVVDAWYRAMPSGVSENDNGEMAQLYNTVDAYTAHLNATWINIHHSSKGDQSTKSVVDVGAGAGSQSRAADAHIILRPHEEDGVFVVEAAVRSFPPIDPVCVRWEYPLWTLASDVDHRLLRQPMTAVQKRREAADVEACAKIIDLLKREEAITESRLRTVFGMNYDRAGRLLAKLKGDGKVTSSPILRGGKECEEYRLTAGLYASTVQP